MLHDDINMFAILFIDISIKGLLLLMKPYKVPLVIENFVIFMIEITN